LLTNQELDNLASKGFTEGDFDEIVRFCRFLAARKVYRKARDEGRVTPEMAAEYRRKIDELYPEGGIHADGPRSADAS
jgi:hypothetical protein